MKNGLSKSLISLALALLFGLVVMYSLFLVFPSPKQEQEKFSCSEFPQQSSALSEAEYNQASDDYHRCYDQLDSYRTLADTELKEVYFNRALLAMGLGLLGFGAAFFVRKIEELVDGLAVGSALIVNGSVIAVAVIGGVSQEDRLKTLSQMVLVGSFILLVISSIIFERKYSDKKK